MYAPTVKGTPPAAGFCACSSTFPTFFSESESTNWLTQKRNKNIQGITISPAAQWDAAENRDAGCERETGPAILGQGLDFTGNLPEAERVQCIRGLR